MFDDLKKSLQSKLFSKQVSSYQNRQISSYSDEFVWSNRQIYDCLLINPVMAAFNFIKDIVSQQNYTVTETGDTIVDELIAELIDELHIQKLIENILSKLLFGFSAHELVFEFNDNGYVTVDDIVFINPLTLSNQSFKYDSETDEFLGLQQNIVLGNSDDSLIPKQKLLICENHSILGTTGGESILKPIVKEIHSYKNLIDRWDLFIDKKTIPLTVVTTDETDETEIAALQKVVKHASESKGGSIILGDGTTLDIKGGAESKSNEFDTAKHSLRNDIYEAFKIIQIMDQSTVGSYSKQQENSKITFKSLNKLIYEVNNDINKIIDRVIDLNFEDVEKPRFELATLNDTDWDGLFKLLNTSLTPIETDTYEYLIELMIQDKTT